MVAPYYRESLIDAIKAQGREPVSEIERLAGEALRAELITNNHYAILQHRVPCLSAQHQTISQLTSMLHVKKERVKLLEEVAYQRILEYFERENLLSRGCYTPKNSAYLLPWPDNHVAQRTLGYFSRMTGKRVSIEDVQRFLQECAEKDMIVTRSNLSQQSIQQLYDIFKKAGFPLPVVQFRTSKGLFVPQ